MNPNLELWHRVERTPPDQTKPIVGKSYRGNSPKPHYLVLRATEVFGPCGIGWGFTIEERIESGVPDAQGRLEKMSIAKVKVWYLWDGKRGEVEHIGGTPFAGFRKSGDTFIDEDAVKKSVTDALVKALSMIGFAGDIFLGRYDDSKYVEATANEFADEATKTAQSNLRQKALAILGTAADDGMAALELAWKTITPDMRTACKNDLVALKEQAGHATASA